MKRLPRAFVCTVLVMGGWLWAAMPSASAQINIIIRDLGINQYHLDDAQNFYNLDPDARIIIRMPDDAHMNASSIGQLTQDIKRDVIQQIKRFITRGGTHLEIHLIQNINTSGYSNKERQNLIDKFGAAAYPAIDNAVRLLQHDNIQPVVQFDLESNGTKMFAHNVDRLHHILPYTQRVTFVDGRASIQATNHAIDVIGDHRFRIINTHKDYPAPTNSVGNLNAVLDEVLPKHPNLTVLYLKGIDSDKPFDHVASGTRPNLKFNVLQFRLRHKLNAPLNVTKPLNHIPVVGKVIEKLNAISPHSLALQFIEARILSRYDVEDHGVMSGLDIHPMMSDQNYHETMNTPPLAPPQGVYMNPEIKEIPVEHRTPRIQETILDSRSTTGEMFWELHRR